MYIVFLGGFSIFLSRLTQISADDIGNFVKCNSQKCILSLQVLLPLTRLNGYGFRLCSRNCEAFKFKWFWQAYCILYMQNNNPSRSLSCLGSGSYTLVTLRPSIIVEERTISSIMHKCCSTFLLLKVFGLSGLRNSGGTYDQANFCYH